MITLGKFILTADDKIVAEPDLLRWSIWFTNHTKQRIVAQHQLGPVFLSTVFLSVDHSFDHSAPILWETMVFGGRLDGEQDRCGGTREQAEAMHAQMRRRLLADYRNFTWRKFSNRKRRRKAFRQLKRIKP